MFNLIRRDVIIQKYNILVFLPFILVFIIAKSHPALIFLVASIFIPFNAYGYDEKTETNILLNSLPYTRKEIVASRYLGAIVYMILAVGVTSLVLFIFNRSFTVTDIAIGCGLFLLYSALTFPLFYIFKRGNITTVVLITFVVIAAILPIIISFVNDHFANVIQFISQFSNLTLYVGIATIIMTLYIISWGITTIIYQRKAF